MAEKIDVTHIKKFDGNNYHQWKFQMQCALKAKGLFGVAKGTEVKPEPTQVQEEEKWVRNDARAMFVLTSAMELSQITLIENCETSKEILEKLTSIYEQRSETNKMIIQERFHEYKMQENDSIAQHVAKVENLARQIRESGDTISDVAIITKIISTLPQKYRNLRQAWLSLDEGKQTITNLTARLLDEEANLTANEKSENAFAASIKKQKYKNNKSNITCYNCQKKGHISRECRAPRQERKNLPNSDSSKTWEHGNFSAFTTKEEKSEVPIIKKEDAWIMDSGASAHMTYRKDYFQMLEENEYEATVSLGNNNVLTVKGRGTVEIKKQINGKWYNSIITNVLYVPELRKHLFSEGVLTNKGMKIIKQDKFAYVYDNNKLVAYGIRESNNLYCMQFKTNVNCEVNVTTKLNDKLKLWHERLGHINIKSLHELVKKGVIDDIDVDKTKDFLCEACLYGKQHRFPFAKARRINSKPGELIYSDLCGPMSTPSIGGANYFALFKDDCTNYRVVSFIKHKSDVLNSFKHFARMIKNKYGHSVKVLHVDNGKEFINEEFNEFLSQNGIEMERTAPYTPEQNGRAEREMRTIIERARCMLYSKDLPTYLWGEAVNTAVYLLNRTPTSQTPSSSPYEKWSGKQTSFTHLKTFGSVAYMHLPKEKRTKLEAKSKKLLFVGYDSNSTNYRLFDPLTKRITISRNVVFDEKIGTPAIPKNIIDIEVDDVNEEQDLQDSVYDENQAEQLDEVELDQPKYNLRSKNTIKPPNRFEDYEINYTEIVEPLSYEEAMLTKENEQWSKAVNEELDALHKNQTWDILPLPKGKKPIGSKWVFKVKRSPSGEVSRFKARLCAKGYAQKEGIDYKETYSPTTRYDSIRIVLAIVAQRDYEMMQFDVKTAFLYGELQEDIYMTPPSGTNIDKNLVCKLNKSLYGLKQSPRCWNKKFNEVLSSFGLVQCHGDKCVYCGDFKNKKILLILYVDDGLIICEDKNILNCILEKLKEFFEITVSEPNCFVGINIVRDRTKRSIFINQGTYVKQIIKRFNMENAKPNNVPADPHTVLHSNMDSDKIVDIPYREAVGSLMFAAIATRPDIMYAVGVVSRFPENHSEAHWNAVKRIIKYLKGTPEHGIEYRNSNDTSTLVGYSDSDYANDLDTRRSVTGYIFKVNNGAVTWCSQRQHTVSLSTTEAEYKAASDATKEAVWLHRFLQDIGVEIDKPVPIHMDNQSAIRLVHNPEFHKRTKHIDVRFHFIRERYEEGEIEVRYIATQDQLADIFTKPLPKERFKDLRTQIGVKSTTITN